MVRYGFLVSDIETLEAALRRARKLIHEFVLTDPSLFPILSEIDSVLERGSQDG